MKIIIGLSGGVDSAVTALLLKQQGHAIEGVFMKNWEADDTDTYCPASQDMADAQAVCDILDIPFTRINFAEQYWEKVFTSFLEAYKAGLTPNPDILCNKEIKFRAFLDYALTRGADAIATGHYARHLEKEGRHYLQKGLDGNKDQSYFLHALSEDQLAKSLFPLGELTKPEVRALASQAGFPNHAKKDSTGICFIGERNFRQFLSEYVPAQPGNIETLAGTRIGQHTGLMFYTIGQRQGLHIGGRHDALEAPWFVAAKDMMRNVLIVVQGTDHPALFADSLIVDDLHWINLPAPTLPLSVQAKTRYRQADQACIIDKMEDGRYRVDFVTPQRAITPGQSVVFYQGEQCLGGGVIRVAIKH